MKLGNNKQNYWKNKCETEILNLSETRLAELIVLARSKMRPRTFLRKKMFYWFHCIDVRKPAVSNYFSCLVSCSTISVFITCNRFSKDVSILRF